MWLSLPINLWTEGWNRKLRNKNPFYNNNKTSLAFKDILELKSLDTCVTLQKP